MKITYARGDDWVGLYIDGKLAIEGHSIEIEAFAKAIGVEVATRFVDLGWLEDRDRLTESESDVAWEPQ